MESGTTLPRRMTKPHSTPRHVAAWQQMLWARREVLAVGAVTALGLGVRLWNLGSKSLWIDETFSIGMVSQSWHSFAGTLLHVQPNMELFYILLKCVATITPADWQHGEVFWHLLPALAGAATIPALYALARRIFSMRVALLACALLAVNEFMVEYSQQARGYTLFVLLLTLSWLALVRALEGERRAWLWFAVLAALGFLTQAFEVIFLVAQLAFIALAAFRRRALPWKPLLIALAPLAFVVVLRYPLYAAHPDQVAWIQRPTLSDLYHGTRQLVGGDGGIPTHLGDLLLLLALASIVWLIVWAGSQGRDTKDAKDQKFTKFDAVAMVAGWFVIPIALTWVGSQVKPVWVTRYLAPCSVAACLMVAAALVAAMEIAPRAHWRAWMLAGCGLLALCAWLGPLHDYQARSGWEDWRGAALAVNAAFQANDGIVCYDNQWGCDFGFSHYWQSFGGPAHIDPSAPGAFSWATYAQADRETIFARAVQPQYLAPYLAKHGRVWVLLGHYANGAGDWRAGIVWLCAHAHLVHHFVSAGDINVYLFAAGGNQSDVYYHS